MKIVSRALNGFAALVLFAGCAMIPSADKDAQPDTSGQPGETAGIFLPGKNDAVETGPFTLPGLGSDFVFAAPNPVISWRPQDGGKIEVQAASSQNFEKETIVFYMQTEGTAMELPLGLREGEFYFLRARRTSLFNKEEWTPAVRISYKPLHLEMKDTGGCEMAVYEMTNALLAEIVTRLLPGGEIAPDGDCLKTKDGIPVLGLGTLNYGTQFGLHLVQGELGQTVLAPKENRADHPAVGLSWYGAAFICDSLSRMFGYRPAYGNISPGVSADTECNGFRMPLEAEWDAAARGSAGWIYPGGAAARNSLSANYLRSGDPFESVSLDPAAKGGPTTPVGFYDGAVKYGYKTVSGVSPTGLHDMMGNVWEWCDDAHEQTADEAGHIPPKDGPAAEEPAPPGTFRVVRGAAWNTHQADVSFLSRGWYKAGGFSFSLGLRLARTALQEN